MGFPPWAWIVEVWPMRWFVQQVEQPRIELWFHWSKGFGKLRPRLAGSVGRIFQVVQVCT